MTDVPSAVAGVVGDWQAGGRPRQQGIGWPRERWLAAFPETADALQALPVRLDRGTVGAACAGAAGSPAAAWQAFVVVMAWGYGTVGYGAWRTARILQGDSHAPDRLASVAQQLGERGALDAYGLLGGACRLRGLGPAFGTKYLYFCPQAAAGPRALILDRLVARWLARNARVSLNSGFWSSTPTAVTLSCSVRGRKHLVLHPTRSRCASSKPRRARRETSGPLRLDLTDAGTIPKAEIPVGPYVRPPRLRDSTYRKGDVGHYRAWRPGRLPPTSSLSCSKPSGT
jgi:hypothetical protein